MINKVFFKFVDTFHKDQLYISSALFYGHCFLLSCCWMTHLMSIIIYVKVKLLYIHKRTLTQSRTHERMQTQTHKLMNANTHVRVHVTAHTFLRTHKNSNIPMNARTHARPRAHTYARAHGKLKTHIRIFKHVCRTNNSNGWMFLWLWKCVPTFTQ